MADHFVSINRGKEGLRYSDFTTNTTSTTGDDCELRVADAAKLTKNDIHNFLEAFERFFENAQQVSAAGFVISDGATS